MIVEFTRHGKTYQSAIAVPLDQPPPPIIKIPFQPCVLRPPYFLELAFLTTDELRGIELYKPIAEVQR
jgi:hypothetical protein